MLAHPAQQVDVGRKALAVREDLAKPVSCLRDELRKHWLGLPITIAEKGEPYGCIWQCIFGCQVAEGFVLQDYKARHMKLFKPREWKQRVVRTDNPRSKIHCVEQRTQCILAIRQN